ncbi:hypothetical protein NEMBOFW57_000300 [Staphylotrichum longicolle]|uniref:Uncharacterized protein n=1 Tax=Staphylotrichum longicolle TaxID=669026 RepID=A0AAD4EZI1_9PEZI|nr:hypothetical protein NEMBOFW57_000300 [Staphylotrichum longicolle]
MPEDDQQDSSQNSNANTNTSTTNTTNPFVRFKHHVDARIHTGINAIASHPPEANLAWSLFLSRSAYSPLRLHHANSFHPHPITITILTPTLTPSMEMENEIEMELTLHPGLGARPPPRDLPPDCADARFGWLEAFEDLLRAESGLPLMDLRAGRARRGSCGAVRGQWGSGLRGGGGSGREEEEAGRLWEGIVGAATRGVEEGWRELDEARREVERGVDEWAEERKREAKREVDEWRDAGHDKVNGFFDGIGGVVRTLGKVLEDEVKSLQRLGKGRDKDEKAGDRDTDKDTPQTENDLYSVIQSAFHDSERSLSNFFKSLSEGWRDDARADPKPASTPKIETTERVENGITKKTTKTEYVDMLGNAHTKTETTWTDEDGRVVMRQVHSSMGRSAHWEKTFETGSTTPSQDNKEPAEELEQEHKKEGGWFWK